MRFAFTEEQEELRSQARAFLAEHSSSEHVRKAMATAEGFDPALWQRIGAELGWTSVIVPEEYGGIGLTHVELVALLEEMGAVLLCAPFFSTVCLGANALLVAGSEAQKQEHLPAIAEGSRTATLAYLEKKGCFDASGIEATFRRDGSDYVLAGAKSYVLDGHTAELLIVAARAAGSSGDAGVSLFAVPAGTPGLARTPYTTMDQTRKQAEIRLDGVRVPAEALLGEEGAGAPALVRTLDLAAVALSAEQVGGAQRSLDMAVQYAKERIQFGKPIGTFQAIKHKCADMMVLVESARSASYYAGWAASVQDAELPVLASLAKAYASDAYFHCAADNLQIHGGVGFTWEYDVQLHFKRAKSSEVLLGDPAYHREKVARHIL